MRLVAAQPGLLRASNVYSAQYQWVPAAKKVQRSSGQPEAVVGDHGRIHPGAGALTTKAASSATDSRPRAVRSWQHLEHPQ